MSDVIEGRLRDWEDRAVQDLLALPENLEDLLGLASATLTDQLDFGRMAPVERRFLLPDLHKLESDLAFEVPFREEAGAAWVYILLEHRSEPDRTMPLRLLGYMVQLWQGQRRRFEESHTRDWQLTPILPVVFYTGSRPWTPSLQLASLMALSEAMSAHVPRFDTVLLSLWEAQPEALTGSALGCGLLALQQADAIGEVFTQALRRALQGLDHLPQASRRAWEAVLLFLYRMVVHHREPGELEVLKQLAEEELTSVRRGRMEEILMTGAEALIQQGVQQGIEQGIRQGIRQGIEQGVQQGELQTLLRLANVKFGGLSEAARLQINRLSAVQLDELTAAILYLPDLPALETWLQGKETAGERPAE